MSDKAREQMEILYGPEARGEYNPGDSVRFLCNDGKEASGVLLYTAPEGNVAGKPYGTLFVIDDGSGMPRYVKPSQVIQS